MSSRSKLAIAVLSVLCLISIEYTNCLSEFYGVYLGTGIFSFSPESILVFAVCIFLLSRFFKVLHSGDRSRIAASVILGFLIGFCCVWSQFVLYKTTLFDSSSKVFAALAASLGFSVFTIPLVSEMIGLIKKYSFDVNDNEKKGRLIYFFKVFAAVIIVYIPMFLYVWPMNFFSDSWDELVAQIEGRRSTHHTVIHGLMLRKFYILGLKLGEPAYGFQFYTILQMMIIAFAIAVFMVYVYEKCSDKKVRAFFLILNLINPVNVYYAVSADKGTMGIALAMVAMVSLFRILDHMESEGTVKNRRFVINVLVFILCGSMGCQFRNNMVYAFLLGGIVIAVLRKNIPQKIIMLLIVLAVFGSYKIEYHGLIRLENSKEVDTYRETFAFPINCLARIVKLHGDELDPEIYSSITEYIPEYAIEEEYNISIADGVKARANEELLQNETGRFIKLFFYCGLKYPGDYLDQFAWLTHGYWNPYRAWVLTSTTAVCVRPLPEQYADIRHDYKLPFGENSFHWVWWHEGRFKIPLIAWFFRGTVYFWSVIFLFVYGISKKNRRMISISMIPLFYLITVLAGPLCQFRYIYFNVLTLPVVLYALLEKKPDQEKAAVSSK